MESILDARSQVLVAISAAVAAKCQHCFAKLHSTAEQLGVPPREIRATVEIATMVSAKSREFMASFIEQTTRGEVPARTDGSPCGCA